MVPADNALPHRAHEEDRPLPSSAPGTELTAPYHPPVEVRLDDASDCIWSRHSVGEVPPPFFAVSYPLFWGGTVALKYIDPVPYFGCKFFWRVLCQPVAATYTGVLWPPNLFMEVYMRSRFGRIASLLCLTTSMRADVLFNSFGPGGSFTTSFGFGIGGPFEMAYPFMPTETATFDTAALGISTPLINTQRSVNIDLLTDASDSPGTILESFQLMNILPFSGFPAPPIVVDSVIHPLLDANTRYWLAIENPGASGEIDWGTAGIGPTQRASRKVGDDNPWMVAGADHFISGAFEITGTPVSSTPEPSSVLLVGSLLIAWVGLRWRREFGRR